MNMLRIFLFLSFSLIISCDSNSAESCEKDASNGVARIFSLSQNKNEIEITSARENLRNIINRCGVPESDVNVPLLGNFNGLELLIFSYDDNKFVRYLNENTPKDIKSHNIHTPLHSAAFYGSKKMVNLLLDVGFDVNVKDNLGNTPLMAAIQGLQMNFENSDVLLSNGADVNSENKFGISALDWAIINEDTDAIRYLLSHGAIIDCTPTVGPSTFEIATKANNKEIMQLLKTQPNVCERDQNQ